MLASRLKGATDTPLILEFLAGSNTNSNSTSYTFSSVSLGTASSDRIIVVGIGGNTASTARQLSSVVIDGVSATLISDSLRSGNIVSGLCYAEILSGTSGDIVVTFNGSMGNCAIAVYCLKNANSSIPTDSGLSNNSTTATLTLDSQSNGAGIYFAAGALNSTGATWIDANEDYEVLAEGDRIRGAASTLTTSTSTTVSTSSNVNLTFSGATWR